MACDGDVVVVRMNACRSMKKFGEHFVDRRRKVEMVDVLEKWRKLGWLQDG